MIDVFNNNLHYLIFTAGEVLCSPVTSTYPTVFQACAGIVFSHGVWMGSRSGCGKSLVLAVSQKP